jgi:hypothetical protein
LILNLFLFLSLLTGSFEPDLTTQRDIYHIVMHNRLRPAIVPLDNDTTPGVLSDGAGVAYVILLMDASANSQLSRLVAGHGHSFFTERHSRFF